MPRLIFGLWLASVFLLGRPALAQHQFDSWTTENGLPQNSINDILQTRDGYLWVATHGGLVRFDGIRFVVFDRATDGIDSQRITALYEDGDGTLWAATEDGKLIRNRGGSFKTFVAEPAPHHAYRIEQDDRGDLWIRWRGVVTRFDGERFVAYERGDFERDVRPHSQIFFDRRIETEPALMVWWSQDAAGVHALMRGRVQTISLAPDLPQDAVVTAVMTDHRSTLWIHTRNAGVLKVAGGRRRRYTIKDGLPTRDTAGKLLEARNGDLWLVDTLSNLFRIHAGKHEAIRQFTGSISGLYEDREGSIWIGTVNNGLHRVRHVTISLHTSRSGLSLDWVYSILQTRSGAVWVGTWGGGVNRYENGAFRPYRYADGLPSDHVTSLYEDRSGRLWVGTTAGLTYLENGRFRSYVGGDGALQGSVWAIHEDRDNNLWFATDTGLVKQQNGRFTRYTSHEGLSNDRVTTLFEDAAGMLWIGTFQGLTRLNQGDFTSYTQRDGLFGSYVRAIYQDVDGALWIGTYDSGLYRLKNGRLTRYTRRDGLHDNGVFQILEDDTGHLWMGSNRGIYRVRRKELNDFAEGRRRSITSFALGIKDGLATLECNGGRQPAGLKTADGRLWFPTMGGLAVVDPRAIRVTAEPPPVIVEEFRRSGAEVDVRDRVELPSTSYFEIRYTAPSFIKPEYVKFRYRLAGLDDGWIEAGDRRVASFHRIPPGEYRFEVIAANHDGIWNTQGASVAIVVLPPVYRTWWFIALVIATVTGIATAAYHRHVSGLRREHALQTAFSQRLIDSQERERRRLSNEIHDSLGQDLTIIKMRARLSKERLAGNDAVWKELDEIDLLAEKACVDMKEIAYDLRPYQLDKVGLAKTIEGMVTRAGRTCEIAFTTEIADVDDLFDPAARTHIFRIVQESVSNVIKHSNASHATVTLEKTAESVRIAIHDDGQGFSSQRSEGAGPGGRAFGLMGIRERARILGGDVTVRSAEGAGTSVLVAIPREEQSHER